VSDRDGDGRPDQWQYREGGVLVRELFDENGDGRVDRTVRYDPATGQRSYEEEDANQDGLVDSWVEYARGQVQRRRQDASGDGQPDAWSFYRGGQIARVEEDRNGDGFRDRVGQFDAAGKLRREIEDRTATAADRVSSRRAGRGSKLRPDGAVVDALPSTRTELRGAGWSTVARRRAEEEGPALADSRTGRARATTPPAPRLMPTRLPRLAFLVGFWLGLRCSCRSPRRPPSP
jgi:hypothetical protein